MLYFQLIVTLNLEYTVIAQHVKSNQVNFIVICFHYGSRLWKLVNFDTHGSILHAAYTGNRHTYLFIWKSHINKYVCLLPG